MIRTPSRLRSLGRAALLSWSTLAVGCGRGAALEKDLADAARGSPSWLDHELRIAICGWEPAAELKLDALQSTFDGDGDSGTGETTATFLSPPGSKGQGLRCDGRVAYGYRYFPGHAGSHGSGYTLTSVHRVGDPPAIFATIEPQAKAVALGAPVTVFADGWKLPDGEPGAVLRVDVPTAGPYRLTFVTKLKVGRPMIAVFQGKQPVMEGGGNGKINFWTLAPGPAWFLLESKEPGPVELKVAAGEDP